MIALGCRNKNKLAHQPETVARGTASTRREITFSDPVLFGGSNGSSGGILSYFYALLKTQDFDGALNITAPASIKKFGRNKVLNYFKSIDFVYKPRLLSIRRYKGDTSVIRFRIFKYATSRIVEVRTIIFSDTCRLLLPNRLEYFLKPGLSP